MTAPTTAEDWGRLAVSLPGWRWIPGMRQIGRQRGYARRLDVTGFRGIGPWHGFHGHSGDDCSPCDPDDPATAGCLLALLAPYDVAAHCCSPTVDGPYFVDMRAPGWRDDPTRISGQSLGRACIAVAAHIGFWPGGS